MAFTVQSAGFGIYSCTLGFGFRFGVRSLRSRVEATGMEYGLWDVGSRIEGLESRV
jgi:hypothetical protein